MTPTTGAAQEAAADWTVLSVLMEADLSAGDGGADVSMTYAMGPDSGNDVPMGKPIHFELLGFGDATVDRIWTPLGDTLTLWPTHGSHRAASLYASEILFGRNVGAVLVSYRVEAAVVEEDGGLRARIPILTGPTAPMGQEGGFTARLVLPDDWAVSEGFPTGLELDDEGVWSVDLQVTPAMVGFRGRSDGAWRPSIPLAVDLVTLMVLLSFAFVGWRHLSRVARRARA